VPEERMLATRVAIGVRSLTHHPALAARRNAEFCLVAPVPSATFQQAFRRGATAQQLIGVCAACRTMCGPASTLRPHRKLTPSASIEGAQGIEHRETAGQAGGGELAFPARYTGLC